MIGRKHELTELNNLYNSGKSEFVAVYGRRRVGKTFMIDETFKTKFTFRHAGLSPVECNGSNALEEQLSHFYQSRCRTGPQKGKTSPGQDNRRSVSVPSYVTTSCFRIGYLYI